MRTYELQLLIRRRLGILDPQGVALEQSLGRLGFPGVQQVRVDKEIRLTVKAKSAADAKAQARKMCDAVLVNPVLEDAVITVLNTPKAAKK